MGAVIEHFRKLQKPRENTHPTSLSHGRAVIPRAQGYRSAHRRKQGGRRENITALATPPDGSDRLSESHGVAD